MPTGHTICGTFRGMASKPERRGKSYRVRWRKGGRRDDPFETVSFVITDPENPKAVDAAYHLALRAKRYVEFREHRVTRDEVYEEVLGTAPASSSMPTLKEWVEHWADSRRPANPERVGEDEIQQDTLDGYLQVLRLRVLPRLGHLYLSEIDEDTVRGWVKWLKGQKILKGVKKGEPIAPHTVRRAHGVLHQVLGSAVPKWLERNPAARPEGSRKNRVGLPKIVPFEGMYLEPWEVDLIHSHCSPAIADLWFVLVRTGLRLGEALVLRPQDVTVTGPNPEIRVRRALKKGQKIGPPKSEKSRRDVSISTEVAKLLAARCEGKRPRDLLWPSTRAKRLDKDAWRENNLYRRHWSPAVAAAMRCPEHPPPAPPKPKAGPTRKLRPDEVSTCSCPGVLRRRPRLHDGRHTQASELIRDGWLPIEVQHRLGHASYNTTMNIYGHLWQDRGVQERLDRMERRPRHLRVADRRTEMLDDEAA